MHIRENRLLNPAEMEHVESNSESGNTGQLTTPIQKFESRSRRSPVRNRSFNNSAEKYKTFMSNIKIKDKYEPVPLKECRAGEEKYFKIAKLD